MSTMIEWHEGNNYARKICLLNSSQFKNAEIVLRLVKTATVKPHLKDSTETKNTLLLRLHIHRLVFWI